MKKRTKILCTLGPSCESVETIAHMVKAGMNIARLNFSHGTHENHAMLIEHIREVEEKTGEPVAILQDIQGPKIRVGVLPKEGIILDVGKEVSFDTALDAYAGAAIPVDYKELHKHVKSGERFLLNDGRQEVHVAKVEGTVITGTIVVGGVLTSHKGINLPDSTLHVTVITEKDKKDIRFGVEHGVEFIALSFVMNAQDIVDLRYLIEQYEKELNIVRDQPIHLIAKIERHDAVKNIREILDAADGIMIARGDLGIEIPAEEVPIVQKRLIDEALAAGRPVIVATQMLDSMQENPRPTRAEVSDVANAVIDHTDAVMLSNETSTGKYPVETVKTMTTIICETEKSVYDDLPLREYAGKHHVIDDVISQTSRVLLEKTESKLILAASLSGETARLISRYRPESPIAVATSDLRSRRQMNLSWGVHPFLLPACKSIEELIERAVLYLKEKKMVSVSDRIVVAAGEPVGQAGHLNLLEVREVE